MRPTAIDIQRLCGFDVRSIRPFGDSTRAFFAATEAGPTVLRIHDAARTAAHPGEMRSLLLCEEAGYLAPRLFKTATGDMLFPWEDGEGYMTSWIEGEEPAGSVDDACQLGVTTRQLHAIPAQGRDLPTTTFSPPSSRRDFHRLDADPAVRAGEGP